MAEIFSLYWTHLITIRRGEQDEEKNLYASGRNDAGRQPWNHRICTGRNDNNRTNGTDHVFPSLCRRRSGCTDWWSVCTVSWRKSEYYRNTGLCGKLCRYQNKSTGGHQRRQYTGSGDYVFHRFVFSAGYGCHRRYWQLLHHRRRSGMAEWILRWIHDEQPWRRDYLWYSVAEKYYCPLL